MHVFFLIGLTLSLSGCVDPAATYFAEIEKNGFIPFRHPMSGVGTGMIVRGNSTQLMPLAPPSKCFPYSTDSNPNDLRWESDADLANTHYSARVDFTAQLNTIVTAGTPSVTFKFDMTKIRKVDFDISGATAEMFDHISLQEYYLEGQSSACRNYLMQYPFVLNALVAKEMKFEFLDVFGGQIQLSVDNIEQIVDISADVKWHIENGYKLVITTPKYVGYHLGQLRPEDDGFIRLIATELDQKGGFLFVEYP